MSRCELTQTEQALLFRADGTLVGITDASSHKSGRYSGNLFVLADIVDRAYSLKPIIDNIIVGLDNGVGKQVQALGVDPKLLKEKLLLSKLPHKHIWGTVSDGD